MPSTGNYGCCPYPNAVCCANGYTCCPEGSKCVDSGHGWAVVTKCEPAATEGDSRAPGGADPDAGLGAQVCKTGGPLPFVADGSKKNGGVMVYRKNTVEVEDMVATATPDVELLAFNDVDADMSYIDV